MRHRRHQKNDIIMKERTILFLKTDLEAAKKELEEKKAIINQLRISKVPRVKNAKRDSVIPVQQEVSIYSVPIRKVNKETETVNDFPKASIACQTRPEKAISQDKSPLIETENKFIQTISINLEPQVIVKEVVAEYCENCLRNKNNFPPQEKRKIDYPHLSEITKVSIPKQEEPDLSNIIKQEISDPHPKIKINLSQIQEVQSPIRTEERKESTKQRIKPQKSDVVSNTTLKVKMVKTNKALNSITEESADDNFETYDARARKLLEKYQNRFYKSGDVMNKGQMYSPKVVFTRNFSTPKIQDEKRFEPIYYSNDRTMTHSYELKKQQIKTFKPVLRRNRSFNGLEDTDLVLITNGFESQKPGTKLKLNKNIGTYIQKKSALQVSKQVNLEVPENFMKPIFKEYISYSGKSISFNKK